MGISHKLVQTPTHAVEKQLVLSERPLGLLVQLATDREAISPWRLVHGLHAPVLASGDQLEPDADTLLAEDHQAVLLPVNESTSADPVHTTLRDVVLHGRGWYGESVLHLLMLMCDGTAPSVFRRTVAWLLQLPPQEQQLGKEHAGSEHPDTGLTSEDLRHLVNTRYDGSLFLGQTPLHIAAARGDLSMTQLLLSCGSTVDSASASGEQIRKRGIGSSPISFAVSTGNPDLVACLHRHAAPVRCPIDATVIHAPAILPVRIHMHMGIREQLSAVASVHAVHQTWCAWGELPVPRVVDHHVTGLVVHRALVRGSGLLHCAVLHNRIDVYRVLVGVGVLPYVRDAAGRTPLLLAAAIGTADMLAVAIESVCSREWASGSMECMRCPLNEIDSIFRHGFDGDYSGTLRGHGHEVIGNGGHKTVLELIVRRRRHDHLQCPQASRTQRIPYAACKQGGFIHHLARMQVTQLLQDKWDCTAFYVACWEVVLATISLCLLAATTVLKTLADDQLQPFLLTDDLTAVLLPCNSLGTSRASALAQWSLWSSRVTAASSEADFQFFVAFLILSSIRVGELLYMVAFSRCSQGHV